MKKQGGVIRLMSLYKGHTGELILVMFGAILKCATDLLWPLFTKKILDECIGVSWEAAMEIMMKYGILLVCTVMMTIVARYFTSVTGSVLTDKIKYSLQKRLFNKYLHMTFGYFDNARAGSMITLLDYDVDKIDEFVFTVMTQIIPLALSMIGAIVIFSSMSPILVISIIPILIASILFNKIEGKFLFEAFRKRREGSKELMDNAEDKISGVRTIISFGNEDRESMMFNELCDTVQKESMKAWFHVFIRDSCNEITTSLIYGVLLIVGCYLVLSGKIGLSDMTVFLMYSYLITNPVTQVNQITRMASKANASFEHITKMLDKSVDIRNPRTPMRISKINGKVSFDNVSFRYDSKKEDVISDFSLDIQTGKSVAIVGPSGSGKSTIAGLIPRYYDVTEGSIKIDDINIKDFDLEFLRRNVGVVQQDIYLFYGTIYENIAYSKPNASMEEVMQAAKYANAHGFISDLPNGYNSNIGDRGVKLSGGQKQRIAIARIFLENPPIIIFDEATSALDNESEREVQKAMENLSKKRTVITIAHRLTTVRNADEILFLTEEGIEERGTHEQLMTLNGKYAKLHESSNMEKEIIL